MICCGLGRIVGPGLIFQCENVLRGPSRRASVEPDGPAHTRPTQEVLVWHTVSLVSASAWLACLLVIPHARRFDGGVRRAHQSLPCRSSAHGAMHGAHPDESTSILHERQVRNGCQHGQLSRERRECALIAYAAIWIHREPRHILAIELLGDERRLHAHVDNCPQLLLRGTRVLTPFMRRHCCGLNCLG